MHGSPISKAEELLEIDPFFDSLALDEADQRDKQIQKLQEQLTAERDARKEERFFFVMVCMFFMNIAFFASIENFFVPLASLILQVTFLFLLAKRMGMEESAELFSRLLGRIVEKVPTPGSDG